MPEFEIRNVDHTNLERSGFFCCMSKRKTPGYAQKADWLADRFAEGLRLKIIHETGYRDTGFIEYLPGEVAWRAVEAPGYMVIHCLWVVGRGKGKGVASRLLESCSADARAQGMSGVVMVSSDRTWLAGKEIFLKHGFVALDESPPFQLLVQRFGAAPDPGWPQDWAQRAAAFGPGFTILRTAQCPYIEDAAGGFLEAVEELGYAGRVIELSSAAEVRRRSPSPYGVFGIVLDGELFSTTYLQKKDLQKRLAEWKEAR